MKIKFAGTEPLPEHAEQGVLRMRVNWTITSQFLQATNDLLIFWHGFPGANRVSDCFLYVLLTNFSFMSSLKALS